MAANESQAEPPQAGRARWSAVPARLWKVLLGIGALAGVVLSVAGVVGLFSGGDEAADARPVVDRIEEASARYGSAQTKAVALRGVVGFDAGQAWHSDSRRIETALRADFPDAVEAWRRYDEALRTAQLVLDDNAVKPGSEFGLTQARRLVELAGTGDPGLLVDPGHRDYDLEWATVLGRLDEQKAKLVEELLDE